MTKTNNNKLKFLVFFFIGLGWSHQTMEDNNKRTHSQRQDNEEDEITQIDTGSRQRIRVDNPIIDTISTIIPQQTIAGFVNKLEDADMTQERLNIGKLTNISDHFHLSNTIGENNIYRQILNPNVFYRMDYDYKQMGPFKDTKVLIFPNQQTIKEETPLVNLNQLKTLSIEFLEAMVGFEKNRFQPYRFKGPTYEKLLTLLKKNIEDVNNPLFQQLFQWINGKLQSTLYEPNKDFSKIKATHKSNFFEDVVKNLNTVNGINAMLIDENLDLFIFNMDEINSLEAKSKLKYESEGENLIAISKQLRQIYEASNVPIEKNIDSFLSDMEKNPQLFFQYSINDGLMMLFFNTLLKDWDSRVRDMEDFLLCFKSTKQVFSIISQKKLFMNRTSQVADLRYNDIDPFLNYMKMRMHNDNLKIFHGIKKPIVMDPLDVILNVFDLEEDFIKNKIYSSFEEHVLLDGYSDDESMEDIESNNAELQKGLGILVNSDDFFLAACCPKWIYGINYCNLLMGKATSPQLDKMFLNDEYNRKFHEIMGFFQVHSVCDLLFKDLKEANLMSIDGYNGIFDIIDNFSTLYHKAPKPIRRNLVTAGYKLEHPFQGTESFNFWHKNREVRPDILITTLLYNVSPENKVNLNLENTLLMLAMTDINFFKKFLTTFKKLYGQMLIRYSQYNFVDPENPDFNLGARNILQWEDIFDIMGKRLINKYPNGFSHNPSIDPKISTMELKQAHGEFLLHMNKILVELILKSFSETDDAEECFAHHPKDQCMSRSYQYLMKINMGAIKKNIKKVVYWSYENASLSHGENSHKANDETVNDINLSVNLLENSDNILVDSLNNFPVNDNHGDEIMDGLDPNQNHWQLDMINNSGQISQIPKKIIEYDLPAAPTLDNSYEVYKHLLGTTCDFSKGNFDNEKLIEFVNNQVDLAVYKIPVSFWNQDCTNLDIIFEKSSIEKGFQHFLKICMEIKIIKDLLKETIAQGLSSKDEDSSAFTIYTTDPAVDALFNFGLRKTEIDGNDEDSQESHVQLTDENTTFYLIQKAINEFSYKISKSLPMDVRAINHLIKNKCTIDPSHVEACKFLKVLIQGRQQYIVGNKLKLRNPNEMAIQNCAIPHRMFLGLTGVGVEVCSYILNLPRHIIFALLETMKFQMNIK